MHVRRSDADLVLSLSEREAEELLDLCSVLALRLSTPAHLPLRPELKAVLADLWAGLTPCRQRPVDR